MAKLDDVCGQIARLHDPESRVLDSLEGVINTVRRLFEARDLEITVLEEQVVVATARVKFLEKALEEILSLATGRVATASCAVIAAKALR
jgi:hypothetical protein